MEDQKEDQQPKSKISMAELQQLLALNQNASGKASSVKTFQQKILTRLLPIVQKMVTGIDRLINFIVKPEDENRNEVAQAARPPILFGLGIIFVVIIVGGTWSAFAPLNSAAVAIGTVVPSSSRKIIQHREGGIVKAIYVKQGDHVKMGDKLIALEESEIRFHYESSLSEYRTYLAAESRLIAERDKLDQIVWPEFLKDSENIPEVSKIMHTQERLFDAKRDTMRAEILSLKQKIAQHEKRAESFVEKKISANKNYQITEGRLKAFKKLQVGGFVASGNILEIESKVAELKSNLASVESEEIANEQEITRLHIELNNLDNKSMHQTLHELKETQQKLSTTKEQYITRKDSLDRIVIKSPVDGIIQEMKVHTIGGVVSPAHPLMEISPNNDKLVIDALVSQKYIDAVHVGLKANIKFSAFKSRTTPSFRGTVVSMSPDVIQMQQQDPRAPKGEPSYMARIEIDMDYFNKIAKPRNLDLHPGMQAEVQIITGKRTLLRYLLDPVIDQMFRAFREK